jgi:ribonuclease HII
MSKPVEKCDSLPTDSFVPLTVPLTVPSSVAPLQLLHHPENEYEICIDEVGRGCLFGRTYIACVILPKDGSFLGKDVKDSKKFSSKKKIKAVAEHIKKNALYWHVEYVESTVIDEINILQAVMRGMHECIRATLEHLVTNNKITSCKNTMAIIDGNYFKPYIWFNPYNEELIELPSVTVEQGDAKYMGIAAASILAKVARDEYILDLCKEYPILSTRYGLETNMGYGTKKHLDGIREHGITQWHRKTFGETCKQAIINLIS